ncbi:hypothetical protein [Streptomyces diastatochromogenes]|uniref:hypothetical protein n=1 Tax=Streptomyces diastatochromogenes TaxID=42236 RepID=UPI001180D6AE|nr:hypothetical protein [Streptomyces diastatochromogenes]MCZ0991306.1 hypothetical protein [Streptomyces diastatochromogenes]
MATGRGGRHEQRVLAGCAALLNACAFYISIFATDDCSSQNPAFRCTDNGLLAMLGLPWAGLACAVSAALAVAIRWRGGWVWCGLPVGALVYVAGLAGTLGVMTS